jgi:FtsH-binding integral membrane protein
MKLFYIVAVLGEVIFSLINEFLDTPIEGVDWVITVLWCILMKLYRVYINYRSIL